MPPDRHGAAHVLLGPPQGSFDLFVALLHPYRSHVNKLLLAQRPTCSNTGLHTIHCIGELHKYFAGWLTESKLPGDGLLLA